MKCSHPSEDWEEYAWLMASRRVLGDGQECGGVHVEVGGVERESMVAIQVDTP